MVVMNTAEGSCAASQRKTIPEGDGLRASDRTFVSRTIIWRVLEAFERADVAEGTVPHRRLEPCGAGWIRRDSACRWLPRRAKPSESDALPPPSTSLAVRPLRGAGL